MVDLTPICKIHNCKMINEKEENGYRVWICEQCEEIKYLLDKKVIKNDIR